MSTLPNRCLCCYQPVDDTSTEYHSSCARKLFGVSPAPLLDFTPERVRAIASEEVNRRISVPGALPKLSLELQKIGRGQSRLTIVQLWGTHIFKPSTDFYPHLPENEDLCMHLAELCGFKVAVHGLIRFQTNELAYLCKRFDRLPNQKLHQEDFCQLTDTLTENKYHGSAERVGKTIHRYATNPGLDCINFFEQVVFSFLIGNSDMHLKNYSLLRTPDGEYVLSPAYDLLSTKIAMPQDLEESALTIQGKKRNLTRKNFLHLSENLGIPEKVSTGSLNRLLRKLPELKNFIGQSFVSIDTQKQLMGIINERAARITSE